jgi:16S rRNA (adenine1518-N6/adenine1519-N6)-dimethyltransferase
MKSFAPKKEFSQNFLTDRGIADKIVAAAELRPGDHIVEIGPGKGVLTERMVASQCDRLLAVDLDERAVAFLATQAWNRLPRCEVRFGDVLRIRLQAEFPSCTRQNRVVVGNIPYAITSDLIFWALEQHASVDRVVMMMQREVAKRCVAVPRTKEYGILTVATWLYAEAKLLFNVQPGSFFPRPAVTSSVIRFVLREQPAADVDPVAFMKFVRAAFSQRRKILRNSLQQWLINNRIAIQEGVQLSTCNLGMTRAEELLPRQLVDLYNELRSLTTSSPS